MRDEDIVVGVTLTLGPLVMQAFPTPHALRASLQEAGVWPSGASEERWRPDFTAPGTYTVQLECCVPRPRPSGREQESR
jgi:hypothetical protein